VKPTAAIASTDIRFPHALHPQHHVPLPRTVSGTKDQKDENDPCFEGLFWNYFSIGKWAEHCAFIIEQSVMVDHVFINIVDSILRMNCSPASS
jgi:hypothetical protein